MTSLPYQRKLMKVGRASTALVLDKDWVDSVKTMLDTEEINVRVFGTNFLVIEVIGLPIEDEKDKKLLDIIKEQLSIKKKVE